MIRVNLAKSLPMGGGAGALEASEGLEIGSADIQRQGMTRMVILAIFPLALWGYEFQSLPEMRSKLNSKNGLLKQLQLKNDKAKGAVEEITRFKEDQATLQKQIDTLESLQKDRKREVKILDNLQKDIPEKVWLTQVEFMDSNLRVTGAATADSEISNFMENLQKSVFLKDVKLEKSTEEPTDKGILRIFSILCVIDRPVFGEVKK
jgi:type IV pilus assembly protein PilN